MYINDALYLLRSIVLAMILIVMIGMESFKQWANKKAIKSGLLIGHSINLHIPLWGDLIVPVPQAIRHNNNHMIHSTNKGILRKDRQSSISGHNKKINDHNLIAKIKSTMLGLALGLCYRLKVGLYIVIIFGYDPI